jgi:ADP-heptose:LPS heptosyltransferase
MKILIFRSGAYGDVVIITPVIRYLHSQGHELYVVTSSRGMEVLKNNPRVHRLIQHKEDTPIDKLSENLEFLKKKFHCEKVINFSESVEVALSQHPRSPNYKLSKQERLARFNKNFYEYSFEHANLDREVTLDGQIPISSRFYRPELFFDERELYDVRDDGRHEAVDFIDENKFNILIGMSGSGNNKTWPWTELLAKKICEKYPDVHIITVGDEKCRLIEPEIEGRITNLSGRIPMRMSMEMTGLVDLVIAPDTGIIHAAGCYDTPKICMLGHNTKECITKHFTNDFSVEADPLLAECSPCLFLIYNMKLQCPIDVNGGAMCMSRGIPMETVYNRFEEVYSLHVKSK